MTNLYYKKHRIELLKKAKIWSNLKRKNHHSCLDCENLIYKESTRCASCAMKHSYKLGIRKKISPRLGVKLSKKTKKLLKKIAIKRFKNPLNRLKQSRIKSLEERIKLSISHGGTGIPYENCNYPAEFFYIRPIIRKKYNNKCQLCNKKGREPHHIDYNKNNNIESNFTLLCHKCNIRVNFDRDYWYAYFTYIMDNYV